MWLELVLLVGFVGLFAEVELVLVELLHLLVLLFLLLHFLLGGQGLVELLHHGLRVVDLVVVAHLLLVQEHGLVQLQILE